MSCLGQPENQEQICLQRAFDGLVVQRYLDFAMSSFEKMSNLHSSLVCSLITPHVNTKGTSSLKQSKFQCFKAAWYTLTLYS